MDLIKKKNTKCDIRDSSLCQWLNKQDCQNCYIMELADKEQAEALQRWEVTQSLLPDNVDELNQSETCHFCVDNPLPRTYYATLDLANPEPESTKGMFFGIGKKVRSRIGSLLPIAISCCSRCRKAYLMADLIKYLTPFVFLAIGVLLAMIPPIAALLQSMGGFVSTLFIIGMFLIGLLVGKMLFTLYINKKGSEVRFNVFDIPIVSKMQDMGWFLLENDGIMTKLIFTKNKIKQSKLKNIDIENKQ